MNKLLLIALFAVAFPVAASAHYCNDGPQHPPVAHAHHVHHAHVSMAPAPSPGLPSIPIVTPAVNGAFAIIRDAFGAGAGILTDTGNVIIGIDPWGRPVYENRGW